MSNKANCFTVQYTIVNLFFRFFRSLALFFFSSLARLKILKHNFHCITNGWYKLTTSYKIEIIFWRNPWTEMWQNLCRMLKKIIIVYLAALQEVTQKRPNSFKYGLAAFNHSENDWSYVNLCNAYGHTFSLCVLKIVVRN